MMINGERQLRVASAGQRWRRAVSAVECQSLKFSVSTSKVVLHSFHLWTVCVCACVRACVECIGRETALTCLSVSTEVVLLLWRCFLLSLYLFFSLSLSIYLFFFSSLSHSFLSFTFFFFLFLSFSLFLTFCLSFKGWMGAILEKDSNDFLRNLVLNVYRWLHWKNFDSYKFIDIF